MPRQAQRWALAHPGPQAGQGQRVLWKPHSASSLCGAPAPFPGFTCGGVPFPSAGGRMTVSRLVLSCLAAPQADHLLHPRSQVRASRQGLPPPPENPRRGHQLLPGRGPRLQGARLDTHTAGPRPGVRVARLCSASMCRPPGQCLSRQGLLLILKGWPWAELDKGQAEQNTSHLLYGQQTSVCRLTLAGRGVHGLAPSGPRQLFLLPMGEFVAGCPHVWPVQGSNPPNLGVFVGALG